MPTSRITLSVTCRWHCRATPRHATRTPRHTTSSAAPCTVLDRAADHKIHEIVREEALASMEAMEAKQAAETRLKEESAAFPEFAASRYELNIRTRLGPRDVATRRAVPR